MQKKLFRTNFVLNIRKKFKRNLLVLPAPLNFFYANPPVFFLKIVHNLNQFMVQIIILVTEKAIKAEFSEDIVHKIEVWSSFGL